MAHSRKELWIIWFLVTVELFNDNNMFSVEVLNFILMEDKYDIYWPYIDFIKYIGSSYLYHHNDGLLNNYYVATLQVQL